jgi:hypothetical protein
MHRRRPTLILLLLAALLAGCNWPLSHLESEPLAAGRTSSPGVEPPAERGGGRQEGAPSPATGLAAVFVSPLATAGHAATPSIPTASTPLVVLGRDGLFSGRTVRFNLPEGYRVLEGLDGGCFLYHESLPGFLVFYPAAGEPGETLAGLLNATSGVRRTEPPLEVDLGGLTFVGLFVETETDSRLFLAAAEGWALVAQGPVAGWPTLAAGLNRVLISLSFEEEDF